MAFTVGIVGLGNVAQGYDEPDGPVVTTHIKACLRDPRLKIGWIADRDMSHALAVRTRWDLSADIVSPDELACTAPDLLCIAAPDETHAAFLRAALGRPPRLILCEKPLAASLPEARALMAACAAMGVPLCVNYSRRWLPHVVPWLEQARNGAFGLPVGATALYTRGLIHNACHNLDLIGAAFGADQVEADCIGTPVPDYSAEDPTVSVQMSVCCGGRRVPILLLGGDGREGSQWGVDIVFERGRLKVWNEDGIRVQILAPATDVAVYAPEVRPIDDFHDKPAVYMTYVWQNLADHLSDGTPLLTRAEQTEDGLKLLAAAAQAR